MALKPALWLRSDRGISLNGSNVTAWADQSGFGRDAIQLTPANQPVYTTSSAVRGLPAVTGAATRGLLAGAAADWTFLHDGTGCTIFLVTYSRATPTNYLIGTQSSSGANRGFNIFWSGTSHNFIVGDGTTQQFSLTRAASALTLNKTIATFATASTPDASVTVNGVAGTTGNAATPSGTAPANPLGICWGGASSFGTDTDFFDIVLFNRVLSANEIAALNAYATTRYG